MKTKLLQFKKNKTGVIGLFIIINFIVIAIFAHRLSPYNPLTIKLEERLLPPNFSHICGTDNVGRDVFSRILYGARISLMVGVTATFLSMFIGLFFGILAGYMGGWTEKVIMVLTDIMLAFPGLLLAVGIAVAVGPGLFTLYIALSIVGWASFARLIRGIVLGIKEQSYIESANAIGCSKIRIIICHILPNCISLILVMASLRIGGFILSEASLSFLGLGAGPPTPTWGSMVSMGADFIRTAPWVSIFPGIAIAVVVIGFNLLGDGLRDLLDPKLKGISRT